MQVRRCSNSTLLLVGAIQLAEPSWRSSAACSLPAMEASRATRFVASSAA